MRKSRILLRCGIGGILHALLYLAFAFNLGVRELIASFVAGTIATAAMVVFLITSQVRFNFRKNDIMQAWRMPWQIVVGTIQVLKALRQQLLTKGGADSLLSAVPFEVGDPRNPLDTGRRALAITCTTATPNTIVLGIVEEQQIMLYHQLVSADLPKMTRNLGARK